MYRKRGQVTVFIIVGIILLASVVFLMTIVSTAKTSALETELEDTTSNLFGRESMRVFIEDCLVDSLEEGLVKIGSQGRLWNGDPGGSVTYSEYENGIPYGTQIYYAIAYHEDWDYINSYPCADNNIDTPDFCHYTHQEQVIDEDTADFGTKEDISRDDIQRDLKAYVINQSVECFQEYLMSNLSIAANIEEGDVEMDLSIEEVQIDVKVTYPINYVVNGETRYHLTDFSWNYPSDLESFLNAAVTKPLIREKENVTFNFSEENLEELTYDYNQLDITFTNYSNDMGDTIIHYWLPAGKILKYQEYEFYFAIENRPPALDYISRYACTDYDYLVVPGSDEDVDGTGLNEINITAMALDPDDDNVTYSYLPNKSLIGSGKLQWEFAQNYNTTNLPTDPGIYEMRFNATDEHGLSDWQDVRILVDEPMEVDIEVSTPFDEFVPSQVIHVSVEDPVYVHLTLPKDSPYSEQTLTLSYDNFLADPDHESWDADIPLGDYTESQLSLPCINIEADGNCKKTEYPAEELERMDDYSGDYLKYFYFSEQVLGGVNSFAEMELKLNNNYCSEFEQEVDETVQLMVTQCYPHYSLEYQNPYVPGETFHQEKWEDDGNGNYVHVGGGYDVNPFLANHTCCDVDGSVMPVNTVCYDLGTTCDAARVDGWADLLSKNGFWQVTKSYTCDGERGNVCGDEGASEYTLIGGTPTCGHNDGEGDANDMLECSNIDADCEGELAWGYVEYVSDSGPLEDGWCNGDHGCNELCGDDPGEDAVVYVGGFDVVCYQDFAFFCDIPYQVDTLNPINNEELGFVCGCYGQEDYSPCDPGFDGTFEGICYDDECAY
jgi:hypothetical protein